MLHQLIPAPAAPVAARFELFSWLGRSLYIPSNAGASECFKSARQCLFSKGKILVIPRLMNNLQHVAFDDLRLQPCWFAMASGRWLQKKLRWRWLTGSNGSQNRFYGSALPSTFTLEVSGDVARTKFTKSQALLKDYLF